MCNFVSWIEKDTKTYFLTYEQVYNTPRGDALRKWCSNTEDYIGHGAIRFYYGIERNEGTDKEQSDFSTPDNFPPAIVKAIKSGEFRGLGWPDSLLTASARDKANAAWDKAYAARNKACAEWEKANAEWEKANAEWNKACAEWEKANAEWNKACAEWEKAYAEWDKADAEWNKACAEIGWDLFTIPENRNPAWR